jgi:hypothetical protein
MPHQFASLSKSNLEISLIHGEESLDIERMQTRVGNVDCLVCMFGTLSHIIDPNERKKILTFFDAVADYSATTVPSRNIFKKEQEIYNFLRRSGESSDIGQQSQDGAIKYIIKGSEESGSVITNQYYLFTQDDLLKSIKDSGLCPVRIGANAISHPISLTKSPVLDRIDSAISSSTNQLLPNLVPSMSSYFECVAMSIRLAALEEEKPSSKTKSRQSASKTVEIEMQPLITRDPSSRPI